MADVEVSSTDMGVAGTMMHGVSCAGMHGCIKADDDNAGANVRMCESCGAGDKHGRRVVGMWGCVEMGSLDVSSPRRNRCWCHGGVKTSTHGYGACMGAVYAGTGIVDTEPTHRCTCALP